MSILNWIKQAIFWYVSLVMGGIFLLVITLGWLIHELGYLFKRDKSRRIYKNIHPVVSILLLTLNVSFGLVSYILIITLIIPLFVGIYSLVLAFSESIRLSGRSQKKDSGAAVVKNVQHYYDGIMYATTVEPLTKEFRDKIIDYVAQESNVIDICCGTGALSLYLAPKCSSVVGIDHASGMILYADKQRQKRSFDNVSFAHADATNLTQYGDKSFDYAVISLAIHEMPRISGVQVLKEAGRIARQVIIVDYMVPQPPCIIKFINRYLEFMAGVGHLKGFLKYNKHNGLDVLLKESGLIIKEETTTSQGTIRIVRADSDEELFREDH